MTNHYTDLMVCDIASLVSACCDGRREELLKPEDAMAYYYVNKRAQNNGDHEVHELGCNYMPSDQNRQFLGNFTNCASAVAEARRYYSQVNGCYYCSNPCHTQ